MDMISSLNIKITNRISLEIEPNSFNVKYLQTKRDRMNHLFPSLQSSPVGFKAHTEKTGAMKKKGLEISFKSTVTPSVRTTRLFHTMIARHCYSLGECVVCSSGYIAKFGYNYGGVIFYGLGAAIAYSVVPFIGASVGAFIGCIIATTPRLPFPKLPSIDM